MKKQLHIISHTHWDREWYLSFEKFRLRLVDLIDNLLKIMEKDPEYKYFTLDGQTVVLEDYLEIRPENRDRLAAFIKEGRLFAGPWYILPDEFLVSGEALIRNLLLGHRIASQFGRVMKVGYIPDTFGHISQLPQILSGFGINNVILWRGVKLEKSENLWESPDGSKVLMIHLGKRGYCNAHSFPCNIDKAYKKIMELKEEYGKRATTPHFLLLNGCDHLEPQKELPDIIRGINEKLKKEELIHSNLPLYIQKIKESDPKLHLIKGEFRNGLSHAYLLIGVISTRMYLKQLNFKAQNLLEKWAEPFSSIYTLLGGKDYFPHLWQAWKYLLQNHPHDSICGCSIDEVHRQMLTRYSSSQDIGEDITQRSLNGIAGFINKKEDHGLLIFNPLSWERNDLVEVEIDFPQAKNKNFKIYNAHGKEIPYQIASHSMPLQRQKIYLRGEIPPFGYSLYRIVPDSKKVDYRDRLVPEARILENEFLKVKINQNGTLNILDKDTKKIYKNCNLFEDGADSGDEYNYSYPEKDKIFTTIRERPKISLFEKGPIKATYSIDYNWRIPTRLSKDRKKRSKQKVSLKIQSFVILIRGIKRIEVETRVNNTAKDHRLRVLFPSGVRSNFSWAEGQFDILKRKIKTRPRRKNDLEEPLPTHPHQAFIDVNDGRIGLAIANQGLPEYEVKDNRERTIALTLLRSVGYLSRPDLLTRPGNAGPLISTPEAQCPGMHVFSYAIIPHKKDWFKGKVIREAHNFVSPLTAFQFNKEDSAIATPFLPERISFIKVEPEPIIITTVKRTEKGRGLIIRLFNLQSKEVKAGKLTFFKEIKEAFEVNLAEEKLRKVEVEDRHIINFNLRDRGLITFLII